MSFTHYSVDTGIEASQAFWTQDSVADHVELCDYETTLPVFLRCLPQGEAILDAGCGLARWVIYLRYRGYKVFGVDRAHRALSQARRLEESTPLFSGDTTVLPLPMRRWAASYHSCGRARRERSGAGFARTAPCAPSRRDRIGGGTVKIHGGGD